MFYDKSDVGFSPYGDYWRQVCKICVMELLSAKSVLSIRSIREDETFQLLESIRSSSEPINLSDKFARLMGSISCRATFGGICKDQDTLIEVMKEVALNVGGFNLADLFPSMKFLYVINGAKHRLMKMHRRVDEILEHLIDEHSKNLESTGRGNGELGEKDLVDVLLTLKESRGLDFPITNTNIKAVILDMFTAGTETSATLIEWAMVEMIKNPRIMEKAQAELRVAFEGKKKIYESDIQGLSYLKLVIKEALRLHPPAPLLLPRECREECEIGGYKIPIKTKVLVNVWAFGRNPEYWQDAESFQPERFEESSVDFRGSHFEFIPFGAGRRICPGISFSLAVVELLLAQLLFHFDWKLPGGVKPEELDMTETSNANGRRRDSLYLVAKPYVPSHD